MLKNIINTIIKKIRGLFVWFIKSSWKKKILVVLILLAVGWFAYSKASNGPEYTTDTVTKADITEVVSESGTIASVGSVAVYSPTTGLVDEVFVSNKEEVKENQKLFTVKSTATKEERAVAYAAYQVTASAVQQAENARRQTIATVDRVHDDVKDNDDDESFLQKEARTIAEVANDNAYDALLAARAQLVSAQLAYQATQDATVATSIDGVISNLSVAEGVAVKANSPLSPVSPILMVGNIGATEVAISVGENDINKIEAGQEANLEVDAINNKIYRGTVVRVDEIGTITQGVVSYQVYIIFTDPDDMLRVGMGVDTEIITEKLEDVLSVPNSAVKRSKGNRTVRVPGKNGEIEFVNVEIGIKGGERTQIISGLSEDQVIISSTPSDGVKRSSPFGF